MSAPPKPPPPKPPTASPPPRQSTEPMRSFGTSCGVTATAHKVVLYGPGGVGKTELCANLKQVGINPFFVDLDDGSKFLDVERVDPPIQSWEECLAVLRDKPTLEPFGAIVVDSLTKAEELATRWVVANVSHEKPGRSIMGIEDYGWGKGYTHVYEAMLKLLQALDVVATAGKHVICTAHECTANVPNPAGLDFIRYEPRLQSPPSGKGSIRHRVLEWTDHLLFIGFDQTVEDGKATGIGSRTIYPNPMPTHMAKSRTLADTVPYLKDDAEIWRQLFNLERNDS